MHLRSLILSKYRSIVYSKTQVLTHHNQRFSSSLYLLQIQLTQDQKEDHSALLVGIADTLGDPPFDRFHRLPIFVFSILALSTLEQKVISRSIGDSPTRLDDLQAFISSFFSSVLFLFAK
ncbi:hypothetical protein H5410_042182 [Solanum commersonii]|uniref:Uncharacterized protein n=1 Tax=Solanum commersonii TaxID=4109 RepID=A0A9J5XWU3_SOLCO|nr:hypothetical protein H5410_042182 [Solanum commersonii]